MSQSDADQPLSVCFDRDIRVYNGTAHTKKQRSSKEIADTLRYPSPVFSCLLSRDSSAKQASQFVDGLPHSDALINEHGYESLLQLPANSEPPKKRYLRRSAEDKGDALLLAKALRASPLKINVREGSNSPEDSTYNCDSPPLIFTAAEYQPSSMQASVLHGGVDGAVKHAIQNSKKDRISGNPTQSGSSASSCTADYASSSDVEDGLPGKLQIVIDDEKMHDENEGDGRCDSQAGGSSESNGVSPSLIIADPEDSPRIILFSNGLFYPGTLEPFDRFNLYSFVADEQSAKEPYYLCMEEVINRGLKERIPKSLAEVPTGSRICALRNRQMIGFAPGTVRSDGDRHRVLSKRGSESISPKISIKFDDGDTGKIGLCDVRLLPADFRSEKSLWKWCGSPVSQPPKSRKRFYLAVQQKDEIIQIGDCVEFFTTPQGKLPYVGIVQKLWSVSSRMRVRVSWYYRALEIDVSSDVPYQENALYSSNHEDENEVNTISHKCLLLSLEDFRERKRSQKPMEDVFYLAGSYDHVNRVITASFTG
ncbi:unnamed protein product [Soboliphyme baturini]|uniref:BAH domain-containing protein n=1 Tax=Soboliphyme baturini TaxID=241478 RepID=A0A183IAV3_9BILA|nr:unnamed protein product [Soboliphyme baturini]